MNDWLLSLFYPLSLIIIMREINEKNNIFYLFYFKLNHHPDN